MKNMVRSAVSVVHRRTLIVLFFLLPLLGGGPLFGQQQRYWITFRDKGATPQLSPADSRSLGITDRALWRRSKVLPRERLIDELDLPVNPAYVARIRAAGVNIRSTSRWFNAVSAEVTPGQRIALQNLDCIASIEPVPVSVRQLPELSAVNTSRPFLKVEGSAELVYGPSLTQLKNIKVTDVHAMGISGAGVIIGMLDDGFNQRTVHPALKDIKVLAEYDFIQRDSSTSRSPGEAPEQGNHGSATLSVVGGFENGKLIGAAYGASFILGKTEMRSVEIRLEEDLYVEGLEWMERLGADIVSSSLGYNDWYTYGDFDGNTATTTKAARIATRKGILLVTAMGNEGNYRQVDKVRYTGTMIAPADADSIVSVGAVDSEGRLAGFSSTGPTADGRVKPEVVAQGISVYTMYGESGYVTANGTSFSTPLAAGAAALILSAYPTLTPMQIRDRLTTFAQPLYDASAQMTSRPNNFYGWGMVDAAKPVMLSRDVPPPGQFVLRQNYPNPFNASTTILVEAGTEATVELCIYNTLGQRVRTLHKGNVQAGTNWFQWVNALDDAGVSVGSGVYFCRLSIGGSTFSQKMIHIK